jgi:hypothetical protein
MKSSGPDGISTVLTMRSGRLACGLNTRRAYLCRMTSANGVGRYDVARGAFAPSGNAAASW